MRRAPVVAVTPRAEFAVLFEMAAEEGPARLLAAEEGWVSIRGDVA